MDRKTSTSFPAFTPTSGELVAIGRRPSGATSRSPSWATSGSPTPTPTPGRPSWPRGCSPPGPARARASACSPATARTGSSGGSASPAWAGWRCCSTPTTRPRSSAGCCGTATPRCSSPSTRTSATTTSSGSSRRCPASPTRSTSGSSSSRTPTSARSGRGATGRRPWAAPVADLAARGASVSDALLRECESEVTPADPMVVVYSSGSTSDPKGAIHSHGAAVRHAHNLWQMRDLIADDVLYTPMPLFWVGGFSFTLIAAMHAGATLVFEEQFEPGRHPRPDRAGADHPGARLAAHGQGPRRPPLVQGPRPVVDPRRLLRRPAAAAHPGRRRGAPRQLARDDRDARAAHLRLQGQPAPAREGGVLRVHRPRRGAEDRRPGHAGGRADRRERRAVAARLLADARAPQEGAGRGLHRRRLVPHRRRRLLRRGRALLLHRPDGRPDQVGRHEHHAARRRAGARGDARGRDGLRHRHRRRRARPGRGGGHRAPARRDPRRRRGAQAGEGGDRLLQGPAPHRGVRRPDRAARGSTPARSTGAGSRRSSRKGSETPDAVRPLQHRLLRGPVGDLPLAARRGTGVLRRGARVLRGVPLRGLRRGPPRRRHLHLHPRRVARPAPQQGLRPLAGRPGVDHHARSPDARPAAQAREPRLHAPPHRRVGAARPTRDQRAPRRPAGRRAPSTPSRTSRRRSPSR